MAYQHWSYDTLHRLCMEAFQKFGFTEAEAEKTGVFTKKACMLMPRLLEE